MNRALFPYSLFNAAITHVLIKQPWATAKLLPFAGQIIRIEFSVFNIFIAIKPDGLLEASSASIKAPSVSMSLPGNTPYSFFYRDFSAVFASARISGSAELAETFAFVFRNIEWDIESDLADLIGDVAATRAISLVKAFTNWQLASALNAVQNIKEYVTEESRQVVSHNEIAVFGHSVNNLRDDLARLHKRISRLG